VELVACKPKTATCGGPATAGGEAAAGSAAPGRANKVGRCSFAKHEPPPDGAEAHEARRAGVSPSVAGVLGYEDIDGPEWAKWLGEGRVLSPGGGVPSRLVMIAERPLVRRGCVLCSGRVAHCETACYVLGERPHVQRGRVLCSSRSDWRRSSRRFGPRW